MIDNLRDFFSQPPQIVIEWQDQYSPANGWLVINSLRNGAAGGGTRIHSQCQKDEVVELAKTMEIKFFVSGPPIGGAKSGIHYKYRDEQDKRAVLGRYYKHIQTELRNCYGTGGDQNVNQVTDVIPLLNSLGIRHPQEGIVRGYHRKHDLQIQNQMIDNLINGVQFKIQADSFLNGLNYLISDVATGYGVISSLAWFLEKTGEKLAGKRIVVEGFGNVGGASAYYAFQRGAKIVGVIEKNQACFLEDGLDIPRYLQNCKTKPIGQVLMESADSKLTRVSQQEANSRLPSKADIFITAATSHTLDRNKLSVLKEAGIKLIVNGANNPFIDHLVMEEADEMFSVIPDFIANCGMARVFSYLMTSEVKIGEQEILSDIDQCIATILEKVFLRNNSLNNTTKTAYAIVLDGLAK